MAQYDVHRTAGQSARLYPYLVVVQSGLLRRWDRCITVPISVNPMTFMDDVTTPILLIEGRKAFFLPQLITNVSRSALGVFVTNLTEEGDILIRALDQVLARGYPE